MSLFDELNHSVIEAIEYAKGDNKKGRLKSVFIEEVPLLNKADVKAIRTNLRMTQKNFALIVGVSQKTVEAWESGKNSPSGSASRIMEIIAKDPVVLERTHVVSQIK